MEQSSLKGPPRSYFDHAGRQDVLSGGVKQIPIRTPIGEFRVWTKRIGNNPNLKLLFLHGGPGGNPTYFEAFDCFLPAAGIEYYYYAQLGSTYSPAPQDERLWTIDRFVDELEQVRISLGMTPDNFCVIGHSWGGVLAIEYALKYPGQLKKMIIANMMSSGPAYNKYAAEVLAAQIDPGVLSEIREMEANEDYDNPRFDALLQKHFYEKFVMRFPTKDWPEPKTRLKINSELYRHMQGPSEFGAKGVLENWDRSHDLKNIDTPTLTVGAAHDTMDPNHMRWMAETLPNGEFLLCENGSHFAMYDDQDTFMNGVISFLLKETSRPR